MHERFTAADVRQLREGHPGVVVLAHPECPPEVVAEADFAGSTAAHVGLCRQSSKPPRVVLLTECSMSDNVAVHHPDVEFIRPCNLCPHMKRITLANIRQALENNRARGDDRSRRSPARARRAVERMLARMTRASSRARRPAGHHRRRPRRPDDGAAAGAAAGRAAVAKRRSAPKPRALWAQGGLAASARRRRRRRRCISPTRSRPATACATPTSPRRIVAGGAGCDRALGAARRRVRPRRGWRAVGSASRPRTAAGASCMPPATAPAREIMRALIAAVRRTPSITVLEGVEARRLLVEDDAISGRARRERARAGRCIATDRVVLATGGIGGLFLRHHQSGRLLRPGPCARGARRRRARRSRIHPVPPDRARRPARPMTLITEAVRGEGAVLIDETGERFMADVPGAELAPRDVVARAIWRHRAAGHRVFLDARTQPGRISRSAFPSSARSAGWPGSIPRRNRSRYGPRRITTWAASPWTAPAAAPSPDCGPAARSPHRAARRQPARQQLADRSRSSARAGSPRASPARPPGRRRRRPPTQLPAPSDPSIVRPILSQGLGVLRDRGRDRTRGAEHCYPLATGRGAAADPALVGLMIAVAAFRREESRGGHYRIDFPDTLPAAVPSSISLVDALGAAREIVETETRARSA